MLFNKRKEKEATQQREKAYAQLEQGYEDTIEKAGRMTSPAEQVIALKQTEAQISVYLQKMNKDENKAVLSKGNKRFGASLGSGAAAGAAAGVFGGPIGLAVCVPGGMAVTAVGFVMTAGYEKSLRKKLEALSAGHRERLWLLENRAHKTANAVIEDNVEDISESPLFMQVKALPGCAAKFAEVAAKHIATQKAPEADALPAPKKLRLIKRDNHL